jgi:hypothetical protein
MSSSKFCDHRPRRLLFAALVLSTAAACGANQDLGETDRDATTSPDGAPVNCMAVCETKAASCGEPEAGTPASCTPICAQSPTDSQLLCLSAASCSMLETIFEMSGSACGIALGDGG